MPDLNYWAVLVFSVVLQVSGMFLILVAIVEPRTWVMARVVLSFIGLFCVLFPIARVVVGLS